MKKIKIDTRKLDLKKEKIASLNSNEMSNIYGGNNTMEGGICGPNESYGTTCWSPMGCQQRIPGYKAETNIYSQCFCPCTC